MRHREQRSGLVVLSANFKLYEDMRDRMMSMAAGRRPRADPGELLHRPKLLRHV